MIALAETFEVLPLSNSTFKDNSQTMGICVPTSVRSTTVDVNLFLSRICPIEV